MRRGLGGDHRFDVEVPGIEAAEKIKHLTGLRDGVADVTQLIGESLQLGAVVVDRHVPLLQRSQLGFQVHRTLQLVVLEESLDGVPEGEGGVPFTTNDVEDALGDGG